jgi:cytochrome c oxidase cbb3-type subunit 3/ubiquinol-cytochrome c reductase cytochrome c subunit
VTTPDSSTHPQIVAALLIGLATLGIGTSRCSEPVLSAQEQRGHDTYERMCSVCHGPNGEGYKADQATALAHKAFLATASDELLKTAIMEGRRGTVMSAWAKTRGGPLTPADVDAIVAYLRTWGQRSTAPLDDRPLSGNTVRGAETYARECAKCHGDKGMGGPNVHIGDAQFLGLATNGFLRAAIRDGRAPTAMAAFGPTLGDGAIEDLVSLLRMWQGTAPLYPGMPAARAAPLPLGPVPLHPGGPEPAGFKLSPGTTPAAVVKAELDRGAKMAILDARAPSDYMNEHIEGAVSVPFYDPAPYFSGLPKDAWLVSYCACPHAESGQLAAKLVAAGFKKVTILDEGLGVWRARKYGTHKGDQP